MGSDKLIELARIPDTELSAAARILKWQGVAKDTCVTLILVCVALIFVSLSISVCFAGWRFCLGGLG